MGHSRSVDHLRVDDRSGNDRCSPIDHGAVVAAGFLVKKDVPPYAIVGGAR